MSKMAVQQSRHTLVTAPMGLSHSVSDASKILKDTFLQGPKGSWQQKPAWQKRPRTRYHIVPGASPWRDACTCSGTEAVEGKVGEGWANRRDSAPRKSNAHAP